MVNLRDIAGERKKKKKAYFLSLCVSLCLSVSLCVCLSLSLCLSVCLSVSFSLSLFFSVCLSPSPISLLPSLPLSLSPPSTHPPPPPPGSLVICVSVCNPFYKLKFFLFTVSLQCCRFSSIHRTPQSESYLCSISLSELAILNGQSTLHYGWK